MVAGDIMAAEEVVTMGAAVTAVGHHPMKSLTTSFWSHSRHICVYQAMAVTAAEAAVTAAAVAAMVEAAGMEAETVVCPLH